jgi:glutathione synthase
MKIGFITNTLSNKNEGLTTHDIAYAAVAKNHEVYFMTVLDIYSKNFGIFGKVKVASKKNIEDRPSFTRNLKDFPEKELELSSLDVLLLRHSYNPSSGVPETIHRAAREYGFHLSQKGVYVMNNPLAIQFFSSKLATLGISKDILPKEQLVSSDFEQLFEYCKKTLDYKGVLKPLVGKGSEDILFADRKNLRNNLKYLLRKGAVLVQSYIPNEGDKRVLILNGKAISWYMRVAQEGEELNNLHAGGTAKKCDLTDNDRKIVSVVGPYLVKNDIMLAGIDILGNCLSEINTENPGGTVNADRLGGFNSRDKIIEFLEERVKKK